MRLSDDRGAAMIIAMGALLLVMLLGAVALANARQDVRRAERSVDRIEADSLLDVAVAEAWGEIVGGATAAFARAGTTPTGSWSVTATPSGAHEWDVVASGGDGPDAAAAEITISRQVRHPYTLVAADITAGPLRGRVRGRVGITADAVFGGRSMGSVQELIGPDATCRGCSSPVVVEDAIERTLPAPASSPQPCPEIAGEVSGVLAAGNYLCADPGTLTLVGRISVDGPVVIELGPDVALDLADAVVNRGGKAADFVILQPDRAAATITADGAALTGAILAPSTPMTASQLTWRGSLDVASFTPDSGARLNGSWDASVEDLGVGEWSVVAWDVQPA